MRCPVCNFEGCNADSGVGDFSRYECVRCGIYALSGTAVSVLEEQLKADYRRRSIMSHVLRRSHNPNSSRVHIIASNELESFWKARLPTPQQQADNLVLWLASAQLSAYWHVEESPPAIAAWIGMGLSGENDQQGWFWLREQMRDTALVNFMEIQPTVRLQLTLAGWNKFEELSRSSRQSRTAFMAMKFDDATLNDVIERCFKPAVSLAGFQLRVLTEGQPAGLIDDQMKAAILASRFLVADLTHGSHGAYWEAGFAEGLGIPVIYTCEKNRWEESRTHFDTNHMVTVVWDAADLEPASKLLTATIRATLRSEAKQSD
jgi:hypothetical protein